MNNIEAETLLRQAIELLRVAGPNPLLIDSDDYWEHFHKILKAAGEEEAAVEE